MGASRIPRYLVELSGVEPASRSVPRAAFRAVDTNLSPTNILDLIGKLREENPEPRIVVLTSNFNQTHFENFMEVGATTVVEEGVFASNLFALIQQVYDQG